MAITKRLVKGSALTHTELDSNFTDLDGRVTTLESTPGSDSQTLTLAGDDLTITGGNTVSLSTLSTEVVDDTSPQLGGNLDLNTYDLSTTDPTVSLTTTTTPVTTQGTVGASSETNLSNTTVTVNDDGDYANAVSSFVTLSSTQIDTLGFEG